MICVLFELPYQRQIKKIYTIKFDDFIAKIANLCYSNGGLFFSRSNKYFFYFSSEVLAHEFSCVRFLFLLKKLLNKYINILESYKLIVETTNDKITEAQIENLFEKKGNLVLDENSFYITKKAYKAFTDYVTVENTDENIFKITSFSIFEGVTIKEEKEQQPSIILHKNNNFYWAIYNFILQNPISEDCLKYLTNNEKISFYEVQPSFAYLKKHRFEKDLPEYFIDAFFLYASLYFKIYKIINGKLPIIYSGDLRNEQLNSEVNKILNIIPDAKVMELSKKLPSTLDINKNMLSLIFLITLFSDYLFVDEFADFFESVNKTADFFTDVCDWLYKRGIIFEQNNLYAHSTHLQDFIKSKIDSNTKKLYHRLSMYLVKKYKSGEIAPSIEFVGVLKSLNYIKTDELLLSVFLHTASSQEIIEANLDKKYTNAIFLEGLKYYQNALRLFENFSDIKAIQEIKRAIEEFKYNKFLVGEFKSMLFWGRLNLRRSQLSDAVNYFSYALEIANKINDAEFLCEVIFNLAVVYFLKNDLTLALDTIKKLDATIEKNFAQNWKVYSLFLQGRIYARLGEYRKAENILENALNFSDRYFEDFVPICKIWKAMMIAFSGRTIEAQKTFDEYLEINFDAIIFYLQSFFISTVVKDECEKIFLKDVYEYSVEKLLNVITSNIKKSTKSISGFSFVEDLMTNKNVSLSTAENLFQMFLLYYRGKLLMLDLVNDKNKKSLNDILYKMTDLANEASNNKNIYAQWFFYFCYDVSSKLNGESSSEALSYLSKSFKLMQGRVMVTNDTEVRDKYMQKNFWNEKILSAAKNQKLL